MPRSINIVKQIKELDNEGTLYEWKETTASLFLESVAYKATRGSILCYSNPPVHQVGNPGLDAYLEALGILAQKQKDYAFLILSGANDPVHAGGDLKESLTQLDVTIARKKELEAQGASAEAVDALYEWGDKRLEKGFALYRRVRGLAKDLRIIAVCGGGTRYGGSAEIPLMADYLVGDSRSGMCFSEATIGLIPGWSGVGRTVSKAGALNAKYMSVTGSEIKAQQLTDIGIYNRMVAIPFSFPRKEKTENPEADEARYREALKRHDEESGHLLLSEALELAVCAEGALPIVEADKRPMLASEAALRAEVARRSNPASYEGLWGKPLKEVKEPLAALGRPLAPQSVEALEKLFADAASSRFEEDRFVEAELKADARLYRDPRFRAGIIATLEQRVADFRDAGSVDETASLPA